jgi:hypothetical protein
MKLGGRELEIFKKKTKNWYKRTLFGLPSFMNIGTATQLSLVRINTTFRNENPFSVRRGIAP